MLQLLFTGMQWEGECEGDRLTPDSEALAWASVKTSTRVGKRSREWLCIAYSERTAA